MKAQQVAGIVTAVGTLLAGCLLAIGGAGVGAGVIAAFLVAAPATAAAASLRGLDPLARIVLALATAVVVNALVAEAMLVTESWSIPGGVAAVGVLSAIMWLAASAPSAWFLAPAGGRHEPARDAPPAGG